MPQWIAPWRDWAMRDLFWPFHRNSGPQPQGLHFSYEKAGATVRNEPIPWNADTIYIEALLRFPTSVARRKTDFALRLPGQAPLSALTLHRHEEGDQFRLIFRLPTLKHSTMVELFWRSHALARAVLPVLPIEQFFDRLQLKMPTVSVRLGESTVACQAFVGAQGRGLIAGGLLSSATCLAPLVDLDLAVEFVDLRSNTTNRVPVRLAHSQLGQREALISIAAPRRPRRMGDWAVQWTLAGRVLARKEVRVLGQRALRKLLYVTECRYVHQARDGSITLMRHIPPAAEGGRLGPCFLIASRVPGVAATVPLEVRVQSKSAPQAPSLLSQDVIVTDGPTPYMPGTVSLSDLPDVVAFELYSKGQALGFLSTSPAPVAAFTSEGSFKPAGEDYIWNSAADEELADRLSKLAESP